MLTYDLITTEILFSISPPNRQTAPKDSLRSADVLNIDRDGGGVGDVTKSAFVRCRWFGYVETLLNIGQTDVHVQVFQVKGRIHVTNDASIRHDDLLDVNVDKIVERVDVLFYQAFRFEKGGDEFPFFLEKL